MNERHSEVWVIHSRREVLLTDLPGVPIGNGEAADVCHVGDYPLPDMGWGEGREIAEMAAKRWGYKLRHSSAG